MFHTTSVNTDYKGKLTFIAHFTYCSLPWSSYSLNAFKPREIPANVLQSNYADDK